MKIKVVKETKENGSLVYKDLKQVCEKAGRPFKSLENVWLRFVILKFIALSCEARHSWGVSASTKVA